MTNKEKIAALEVRITRLEAALQQKIISDIEAKRTEQYHAEQGRGFWG